MDHLWSPWRYRYVQGSAPESGCIFCDKAASRDDRENLIVHRAEWNFVILNLFPYTTGHIMIVPYQHIPTLNQAPQPALREMMQLARVAESHLQSIYGPDGFNLGMNIGQSAGAGVAGHIHMHMLPRWRGDANFLSTIGETRVMPEELPVTWQKLYDAFESA